MTDRKYFSVISIQYYTSIKSYQSNRNVTRLDASCKSTELFGEIKHCEPFLPFSCQYRKYKINFITAGKCRQKCQCPLDHDNKIGGGHLTLTSHGSCLVWSSTNDLQLTVSVRGGGAVRYIFHVTMFHKHFNKQNEVK